MAWRVTVGATEPLRFISRGARWNPAGVDALYASLDRDAAVAELEFLLAAQPRPVLEARVVSRLSIKLSAVIDLSRAECFEPFGWKLEELTGNSWSITQHVGAAVEFLGVGGLLVPSARATATNLVVLQKNQSTSDELTISESSVITVP